jgi:hypothetical protein
VLAQHLPKQLVLLDGGCVDDGFTGKSCDGWAAKGIEASKEARYRDASVLAFDVAACDDAIAFALQA